MDSLTSVCPVPFEQQPINEYADLRESWFFRWATLSLRSYITTIAWVWAFSWLFAGPIAAASFSPGKYPGEFVLTGVLGASLILALPLLRLYLGWFYIRDRLLNDKIFYEESGWYDGQLWPKPPEVLARDRLIVTYEIQPILQRLKRTCGLLVLFLFGSSLTWICF